MQQAADLAASIAARLLAWYDAEGRRLPGRETRDPWRVLVIEVMSQQTQIERALGAAAAFCARFPTPADLAAAGPAAAVRAWSGLGYNRRAVALWRAADEIVRRHGGRVPDGIDALDALPGVGPYTARAVAIHAYGTVVAPLDVNVRRVVARLFPDAADPDSRRRCADALVDPARPSDSVHALMDLASVVCTRRSPACDRCPLATVCPSAGLASEPAAARRPSVPFPQTRRWLRGALVRELAAASPGAWLEISGARGEHAPHAVREALAALAADGLAELDPEGRARLAGPPEPNEPA